MMYDSILARSFSRHEQKRLGYGAIVCGLLVILFFCAFFKPFLAPLPTLNLQVSMGTVGLKMLAVKAANSSQQTIKLSVHESNRLELTSMQRPKNQSGHLQQRNSTSEYDHHDWKTKVSHDIVQKDNNSTHISQHHDASRNVTTLQMENCTISQHDSKTVDQNSKTLIEEVVTRKMPPPLCNTEEPRTEFCEIKTDIRIIGKSSSVFVVSSWQTGDQHYLSAEGNNSLTSIRPYARKEDTTAMSQVTKWSVLLEQAKGGKEIPRCGRYHSIPAVLFSVGGYVGNNFHEFTDVVIPLYITSRQYDKEVQFLVTDNRPYFVNKFQKLLKGLSKYDIIDIDKEEEVHCFPSATIGLKRHPKEMSIEPEKHFYSMRDFREFLRESYSLNKVNAIRIKGNGHGHRRKPRLLILSRRRTRAFTNIGEIRKIARSLGYKVIVAEADPNLSRFSELVNSCDVLMGIHGAGLTNIVFLPENAVFIQVLPIGGFEWLAKTDFGEPSKDMNLNYLEYKISNEESTLINQYPVNHEVFTDPYSIGKDWNVFKSIFLEKQNVNLDVSRFKSTLVKALQLLHGP